MCMFMQTEMPVFKDIEISNTVWSHAKLHLNHNGGFIRQCAEEITIRLENGAELAEQCVSNTTWGLGKLNIKEEAYCRVGETTAFMSVLNWCKRNRSTRTTAT